MGASQKLVTAVSLVPIITVVGLRGTDVLKVLLRSHCGLPVSRARRSSQAQRS